MKLIFDIEILSPPFDNSKLILFYKKSMMGVISLDGLTLLPRPFTRLWETNNFLPILDRVDEV